MQSLIYFSVTPNVGLIEDLLNFSLRFTDIQISGVN